MGKDFAVLWYLGCSLCPPQVFCVTEHHLGYHVADKSLFAVQSKDVKTSCTTLKTGPGEGHKGLLFQGYSTSEPTLQYLMHLLSLTALRPYSDCISCVAYVTTKFDYHARK